MLNQIINHVNEHVNKKFIYLIENSFKFNGVFYIIKFILVPLKTNKHSIITSKSPNV